MTLADIPPLPGGGGFKSTEYTPGSYFYVRQVCTEVAWQVRGRVGIPTNPGMYIR
jgi:hypothetical protein